MRSFITIKVLQAFKELISFTSFFIVTAVLFPIVGFSLIPLPAQEFGQLISVAWNMSEGTNTSVDIFYNDVLCCKSRALSNSGGQCGCLVSDPGHFDPDSVVDIRAVAWNLVSNSTDTIQVEVLANIKNVTILMLTSYSQFGTGVEGRGNLRNEFPAEYPVKFDSSYLRGPAKVSEWTFICSVSGVTKDTGFFFDKIFPSNISQRCDIFLVLKNSFSSANASRIIDLKESIVLTSITNDGPLKANRTMTFTMSFEKFGSDTCLIVDMGDHSSLLVFGDVSCETSVDVFSINPNIKTEPRLLFAEKAPTTKQIVFFHRYFQLGTYVVKVNASNSVSMMIQETIAVVLDYDCENPNVTIKGMKLSNEAFIFRNSP